jgi:protein tyrosine/serine phosphatase
MLSYQLLNNFLMPKILFITLLLSICMWANAAPVQLAKLLPSERAADVQESAVQSRNPAWAQPVDTRLNLYEITPNLYRSEKIEDEDLAQLKSLDISMVISFRKFHRDDSVFKNAGIKMVRVPMLTWRLRDTEIKKALNYIKQADGKVLIHCQHGADRTGLVAAMYRMTVQGWSKADALDELQNGGYGYHSVSKNIINYIENVDIEKFKST